MDIDDADAGPPGTCARSSNVEEDQHLRQQMVASQKEAHPVMGGTGIKTYIYNYIYMYIKPFGVKFDKVCNVGLH